MLSFVFSEMHDQVRETIRKFAQEEILPTTIERDIKAEFADDVHKKLGELGFYGIMTDPAWGGSGLDTISNVIVLEEIAKVDAGVAIPVSVQNSLMDWIVENFGNDYQKEKFLRPMAEGRALGAYCLSEPDSGSDATQISTSAVQDGDYWVLNGSKIWISTGNHADYFMVFAQTDKALKHKGIVCLIVEKGTEGFEPAKKEDKMGMRTSDTCSIGINNARIPKENMLGGIGDGFKIAMMGLNGGRIGIAAQSVGIAKGAFEAALKYSGERQTFGKFLIDHQMIQSKLAQMSMKAEAASLMVYKAAWLRDNKMDYVLAASQAKLYASTIANEVVRDAVQILGGYGYVREYHVERMMRDAKVTEIYEGTSEIQTIVIARELKKMIGLK